MYYYVVFGCSVAFATTVKNARESVSTRIAVHRVYNIYARNRLRFQFVLWHVIPYTRRCRHATENIIDS